MSFLSTGIVTAALCLAALCVLMPAAEKIGLVDKPDARKRHRSDTPLVGGLAICLAVCASSLLVPEYSMSWTLVLWFGMVLGVGVIDDKLDIDYRIRLGAQAAVVGGIWITDGLVVNEIGALLSPENLNFYGDIAVVFTGFGVLGAVNSTNMMDGLDGLLGSLLFVSIVAILVLAATAEQAVGQSFSLHFLTSLVCAITVFLCFNIRLYGKHARVFLGDAGSTTLGLILAYILIDYSQGSDRVFSPVLAGWILGLPLLDASAVILRRLLNGCSPFAADRNHLHHKLLDAGFEVNQTVLIMVGIHALMIVVGIFITLLIPIWSDMLLFWGFVLLVLLRTATHPNLEFLKTFKLLRSGGRIV